MLRFSANLSLLFTEVPLSERFQWAKQAGFKAVELQFPYELPVHTLKALLDEYELKLVLFNVAADDLLQGGEGLAAVPEKQTRFKEALAQALDYAKVLQPEVINVLPGRCINPERRSEYLATFRQNLGFALTAFSSMGIRTVFEAINTDDMPGFLIHTEQQMLDILSTLKHPLLRMQYDIYHMAKMQQNPVQFIAHYAEFIGHIQFADVPQRGQPGTGTLDFAQLFKTIEHSSYNGWLGAEYKPLGPSLESLEWFEPYKKSL